MSHWVVIVIAELPEQTPFRGRVKLTAEGAAEMVRVWPYALLQPGTRHNKAIVQRRENELRHRSDMVNPEKQKPETS